MAKEGYDIVNTIYSFFVTGILIINYLWYVIDNRLSKIYVTISFDSFKETNCHFDLINRGELKIPLTILWIPDQRLVDLQQNG